MRRVAPGLRGAPWSERGPRWLLTGPVPLAGVLRPLEETGFVDVAAYLRDLRPTVGHDGGLRYRCDRIYGTFPLNAIVSYEVIEEHEPVSGHRPLVATFDLESANHAP
jgi:hypothetical protein